jgi:asparagine synthase (glutamine-hydrolysing)
MCGIAGEAAYKGGGLTAGWLEKACEIMAHRGPDGTGTYTDDRHIALGHRRLAIIDLAGGHQPMSYADGRYWITYNGEVYNFRELRSQLQAQGFHFHTKSDTEVILAGYVAWGVHVVERLNGIFAFGLWDADEKRLLLARDHLGVKPLLYHEDRAGVRFSSELKALLAHPQVKKEIDPQGLQDYLRLGYVLAPRTIITNVRKLPPGHILIAEMGEVRQVQYWDLASFVVGQAPKQADTTPDSFRAKLNESVTRQLISDVPLGAFLSGGIDSSSVAYFANESTAHALETFSIGFDETSYSELSYARQAAQHIETKHYDQVVGPLSLEELESLVWLYDEPLGDTSIIPTFFVSKLAREHVTVVLSGDGGDELLAGYDTYLADHFQRIYTRIPAFAHHHLVRPVAALIPSSYRKVSLDFRIKQFISKAYTPPEQAHFGWREMFTDGEIRQIAGLPSNGYSPFDTYAQHYRAVAEAHPLNRALYVDIKTWLTDDILVKVDRASMACRLEARVPLLDPRFVEYAFSLPPNLKMRGLKQKYILKRAMQNRLPDAIINRQKKGFNAPISIWMRDHYRDELNELFHSMYSSIVDLQSPAIQSIWHQHRDREEDHGFKLWTLLSLVLWEKSVLQ